MTTVVEPEVTDQSEQEDDDAAGSEDLGGKPNSGTPADKRLKTKKVSNKNSGGDTEDLADTADAPAETTPEGTIAPNSLPVMQLAPQWRGVLVVEGQATGDGREFAADAIKWATPPLPLRWQKTDSHGGMPTNETVRVGTIQRVWRDGTNIMGEGVFDLGGPATDDAHAAYADMESGALTGVSIDADDITDADIEYVFPDNPDEEEDGDLFMLLFAAPEKVIFHAARIRAATLCDIPAFVEARLTMIPADEQAAAAAEVHEINPEDNQFAAPVLIASAWQEQQWRPPKSWFNDPKLGQYVPVMVTDSGRVYGHAAPWGQCHIGYGEECIMPPFEEYHEWFLTGEIPVDDGGMVSVGQITAGIEHAALHLSPMRAKEHYENTKAVVADVTMGNDAHGIWVAGAIRPWAEAERVHALRASGQVSPDWRFIGSQLRMVGLLTVNTSGYQIPKPKSRTLVASGKVRAMIVEGLSPIANALVASAKPSQEYLDRLMRQHVRDQLAERVHGKEE